MMAAVLAAMALLLTLPADVRVAFIPLDDRPATERFPREVASICGVQLELPPQPLLGHFTHPGDPAGLGRWLAGLDPRGLTAVVISTDMLAYGGLVASRAPETSLAEARAHLQTLLRFHEQHPAIPIYAFGTIARLAPTKTPQSEPYIDALTTYATYAAAAHPSADDKAALEQARAHVPDAVFSDYIGARARDFAVDRELAALSARGVLAWLAITQDDAGSPDGLQNAERKALAAEISAMHADSIWLNPGADEMGMVALTRAIEDAYGWYPSVRVEYSSLRGPSVRDPLEDVAVGQTVGNLEHALRLNAAVDSPDFTLSLFTPVTPIEQRQHYFDDLARRLRSDEPIAVADVTLIDDDIAEERVAFEALQDAGVAAKPLAFSSWNTTANSVGTALSAGTCAALAAHAGLATQPARETFLYEQYVDDYAYRLLVRPSLNAELGGSGADIAALGDGAADAESMARRELWPLAVDLFDRNFAASWSRNGLSIYLPWQRTFEVQVESSLTRRL